MNKKTILWLVIAACLSLAFIFTFALFPYFKSLNITFIRYFSILAKLAIKPLIILLAAIITLIFAILLGQLCVFAISKIYFYLAICTICQKHKFTYKINRIPFASLRGVKHIPDLTIKNDLHEYHIHFIDVVFWINKAIVFSQKDQYCIVKTSFKNISRAGGGRSVPMAIFKTGEANLDGTDKALTIPPIQTRNNTYHYLIISPSFIVAQKRTNGELIDINAEVLVGNAIVCRRKSFIKRIKGKLHVPLSTLTNDEIKFPDTKY